MGQCGRSPCCPTPAEAGDGGWGLTAIRQPPPACPKQELLSEAGPGLAATLGDGWLHLHLTASSSALLKEQEFYFISTMHWAIPSSLSADCKRSPKQNSCCCWLPPNPTVFCRNAQRGSSFSFVAIRKTAVFCYIMSVFTPKPWMFYPSMYFLGFRVVSAVPILCLSYIAKQKMFPRGSFCGCCFSQD